MGPEAHAWVGSNQTILVLPSRCPIIESLEESKKHKSEESSEKCIIDDVEQGDLNWNKTKVMSRNRNMFWTYSN